MWYLVRYKDGRVSEFQNDEVLDTFELEDRTKDPVVIHKFEHAGITATLSRSLCCGKEQDYRHRCSWCERNSGFDRRTYQVYREV
ncbi:MAG: hypothetical protein ACXABY_10825 [Candidatus Thorarchaeota archaeon]|jgi:hypothetical protein